MRANQQSIFFIKKHWQILLVTLAGVGMFIVYAWFPVTSSLDLYKCGVAAGAAVRVGNDIMQQDSEANCDEFGSAEAIYKFNSPDETLNFFWAQRYTQSKSLYYEEPLEGVGNNLLRPRSVNVMGDKVMPGSFMGMYFIYGGLARLGGLVGLGGVDLLFYLTTFFSVMGIVFFYKLIELIFNKNTALLAALLAYVMPAWLYYSSRSFYHNVLFVTLLIVGLYFLLKAFQFPGHSEFISESNSNKILKPVQDDNGKNLSKWLLNLGLFALAGLFIGFSLVTRTSELGWVALTMLLIVLINWRKFLTKQKLNPGRQYLWHNWLGLALFMVFTCLAFLPLLLTNYQLYGAPLSIGYSTGVSGDLAGLVSQPGLVFRLLVSPFGFDWASLSINGYSYLIKFFWYFSGPALLGILVWLINFGRRKKTQTTMVSSPWHKQLGYLIIVLIITAYLLIYYGSWQITDRIDEQTVSIGTSYVRYWLPVYLGLLPFVAYLINLLLGLIRFRQWPRPVLAILIIFFMSFPGLKQVFYDTDESLSIIRDNIRETQTKLLKIRQEVPPEAVVVLGYKQADKIFFPEYPRLITELAVPRDYEALVQLAKYQDMYYYHFVDPDIVETISRREFEPYGLRINSQGQNIYGRDWLYQMELVDNELK